MNELSLIRKRLDRYKDSKPKAREVYTDIQQQHGRFMGALNASALALLEMDLPDIAGYSVKLGQSVKGFNLMTPDYSKLCAALNGYLAKLPTGDTTEAQTTNAHIIGRLMSRVKMGYYPTEREHVKHIARGIGFPESVTANIFEIIIPSLIQYNNCPGFSISGVCIFLKGCA